MPSLLVFDRVYRLEIQSVMLVFTTGFVKQCPWLALSPPPRPCVKEVYCTHVYMYSVLGGEYGVIGREGGLRQIFTSRQVPLLVNS
jgi:hypothetical protein